jgi:hypothetical protein
MRQEVYRHHSKREGYVIVTRSKTYVDDMAASKFCLAPTGGGHGKRQVLVARFGCIPVPITDYVLQPFEPELDWTSFSVPVLEADVWKMHEILSSISDVRTHSPPTPSKAKRIPPIPANKSAKEKVAAFKLGFPALGLGWLLVALMS